MSTSASIQSVGYFGAKGSFTYGAAAAYFKDKKTFVSQASFEGVFRAVSDGEVQAGLVPIENTLSGSIYENYDLLDKYKLDIIGEISRRVEHHFLVRPGKTAGGSVDLQAIKKVYSHQKAIEQCSLFLSQHPWIEAIECEDTASAAKLVSESDDPSIAAIAGAEAEKIYGLHAVKRNIENNKYNYTRFLVIAQHGVESNKTADKCSLIIQLKHIPGSLSKTLALITDKGCNLTKIESRPMPTHPFEYIFYLDFVFDPTQHNLDDLLTEMKAAVVSLRVTGIYRDERTV